MLVLLTCMGPRADESFFATPSTPTEVLNIINSFPSKSCNIDDVPVFIYKHLAVELSPLISLLFNHSIVNGLFPDCLKLATIIPIFKASDKQLPNNYRPISLINTLSKIFEKLMSCRMWSFIKKHNIISNHQFGFRGGRNTADAVLEFVDGCVDAVDRRHNVIAVMLDLKKAFDTVNHNVLMKKMERMGFRGVILQWFGSYLSNRRIRVAVGGVVSEESMINIGLPQGNVCSPLLFIMYINDMFRASGVASCLHFADDTTLYLSNDSLDRLCTDISGSLLIVSRWLSANRLTLNIDKTNFMLFSHNEIPINSINVHIGGKILKRVHNCNFLGIKIDDRLKFNSHISDVCSKISRAVGVLFRMSVFVPPFILKTIYYSILYPHLIYGVVIWGNCGIVNMCRVKRIHKRAERLIQVSNNAEDSHCNKLLSVQSIVSFFTALKFHKCVYGTDHMYFSDKINNLLPIHSHDTRFASQDSYNVPRYKKSISHNFFLYNSIILWNNLPSNIKSIINPKKFKSKLKLFILDQINM